MTPILVVVERLIGWCSLRACSSSVLKKVFNFDAGGGQLVRSGPGIAASYGLIDELFAGQRHWKLVELEKKGKEKLVELASTFLARYAIQKEHGTAGDRCFWRARQPIHSESNNLILSKILKRLENRSNAGRGHRGPCGRKSDFC